MDEEKKRLYRSEKIPMLFLMNAVSAMYYAKDDLKDRLASIPDGMARMDAMLENANKLLDDVLETVPTHQQINLLRTGKEYEMRIVPKATQPNISMVLEKEDVRELVDGAQEAKCTACVLNSVECRNCKLAKVLEKVVPLDRYNSTLCPYNMAQWEN